MPLFNVELSLSASIVVIANSEDDALQKAVAAHKAGIDPARAWFSDDMFNEPEFKRVDFDGEENVSRMIA
ncbi:hypothetical protein [Rhizobium leguminosarum]|uniref:hypothetical protein n=1 Tax=Rhizobium leguminosarum TaxID=384 RepID=UPI0011D089EF|nr:hypothetical protein [Rhizobium leguminosarum]NKL23663.1 hypothetical protein [Rhizobium leguminosarum bv. viciae]